MLCYVQNNQKLKNDLRLAELDQILVRGPRMEAANIQIGFAQLFPSTATAVATTVGVGTGGCHLVAGGHIGLLQQERNIPIILLCTNIYRKKHR